MQPTSRPERPHPVALVTLSFPWNDSNHDNIPQQSEWLPSGATPVGSSGAAQINRNMSRPYSEEASAGYEKQLWRDLRVGATYYYRTKTNLFGIENAAVQNSNYVPITWLNGSPIMK